MGKLSSSNKTVYIKDIKSAGTAGGTFNSGAWQTRVLNTLENPNSLAWVSLTSNQFTLQAGTYEIEATAPGYAVGEHKIKLRNITDSSDTHIGNSAYSSGNASSRSCVYGLIVITGAKTYEIQHYCSAGLAGAGFGNGNNFGVSEVFTQIKLTKIL